MRNRRARRSFAAVSLAGWILAAAALSAGPAAAQTLKPIPPPEEERLVYDISFLIFQSAAVGSLVMKYLPDRGLFEGVVSARTKGVIGLVSFYRQDTYRSLMRLSPGGKLIPVEFHREVRTWGYHSTSATVLDYKAGLMRWKSAEVNGDEAETEAKSHPIPEGAVYEDFISAFSNLRRGVYGPIRPGKEIRVLSLPTRNWFKERRGEPQYFTVKVGDRKVERDGVSRMMVAISVPKDLFGQRVGDIRFHVREDNVPSRVLVRKAILFGDVRGLLRSREISQKALTRDRPPSPGRPGPPQPAPLTLPTVSGLLHSPDKPL
ncbi:MAG: DUF3108 domain-containing protein [Candidatus Tectomicrobia bacterium]|nr:DUF3108 domain-containing protein [Candidatus Tectomicrobia bacterium]